MSALFSSRPLVRLLAAAAGSLLVSGGSVLHAQSAGTFVIPAIRAGNGTQFAYWDLFRRPTGSNFNYNYANPPALAGGLDDEGNANNFPAPQAMLLQTGSATCFVTSSGALYDFAATTAFQTRYTAAAGAGEVTNVIFQTQTGGSRFDIHNIRLVFRDGVGQSQSLAAQFKALDDPQSGAFAERLVSAFQWNLTGLGVQDFQLEFSAPGSSMPLWQAQLDVVSGARFVQELGYLLLPSARPVVRFERAGLVRKKLPSGAEDRFFLPSTTLDLSGVPSSGWAAVGWVHRGVIYSGEHYSVLFGAADESVTALFAPENFHAWRDAMFLHSNSIIGQPADNLNDAVSGPEVDYDHDGAGNFAEFAFGGDPYASDHARMAAVPSVVDDGGVKFAAVTYRQAAADGPQILYTPRVSGDLMHWQENAVIEVSRVLQNDGTTLVTVRAKAPLNAVPRVYFSIKAE